MNQLTVKAYYQKAQTPFNTMEFNLGDLIQRETVLNTEEDKEYPCDTYLLEESGDGLSITYSVAVTYYGIMLWINKGNAGEQFFDFRMSDMDDVCFETTYIKNEE